MKTILNTIKRLIISNWYVWIAAIIAIINTIIWNEAIGVLTFLGIVVAFYLYLWGRQIYWRITKTGDYEDKDKKE